MTILVLAEEKAVQPPIELSTTEESRGKVSNAGKM
jgi:hypothetical protein